MNSTLPSDEEFEPNTDLYVDYFLLNDDDDDDDDDTTTNTPSLFAARDFESGEIVYTQRPNTY